MCPRVLARAARSSSAEGGNEGAPSPFQPIRRVKHVSFGQTFDSAIICCNRVSWRERHCAACEHLHLREDF